MLNELDKQYLQRFGLINRTYVVDMGVSINEISKIDPPEGVHYNGIFLGRIHPQKGVDDLIKIWRLVCDANPNAKLAIVGGGDKIDYRKLETHIESLKLKDNVEILGFQTGEKKYSLLKSAKCFLMPSYYESWGMVAVEAMACGLPVVSYDLPIFNQIFSGGMLRVSIGNIDTFAKDVLSLQNDVIEYNNLKKEALGQAKNYDWDFIMQKELQLIRDK